VRFEQVFVVERARHLGGDWPQGFVRLGARAGDELLAAWTDAGFFVDRALAERRPDWKQLIPYCVISREAREIFVVRRTSAQSEARLHGRYSIGLGGHLGPEDGDGRMLIRRGLLRELDEELVLPPVLPEPRFLGLLNDDTTEVGSVHVGLVFCLDLPAGATLRVRENHKMSGNFATPPTSGTQPAPPPPDVPDPALARVEEIIKLWQDLDRFESWSRILLQANVWRGCGGSSPDGPAANRS